MVKIFEIKNFRNYDLLDMSFDRKTNILYGDNAQGKTNILEALSVGNDKVPQGNKRPGYDPVRGDESHLEMVVEKKGITFRSICI